jgi:hypothetical protein
MRSSLNFLRGFRGPLALLAVGLVLLLADARQEWIIGRYFDTFFDPSRPAEEFALKCNSRIHSIYRGYVEAQNATQEHDDPASVEYRMATVILKKGGLCAHRSLLLAIALRSHGIPARKLLIGVKNGIAQHIVVEAWLDGEWRVFDPLFGYAYRRADGELATVQDLAHEPELLSRVVRADPQPFPFPYPEKIYHYRNVTHFNWHKLPMLPALRDSLGSQADEWEPPFIWNSPLSIAGYALIALASALALVRRRRSIVRAEIETTCLLADGIGE